MKKFTAITMVKSNNHLINCFERNKNKCAVVTIFEKVTFNQIKVRSFELISFLKKRRRYFQ